MVSPSTDRPTVRRSDGAAVGPIRRALARPRDIEHQFEWDLATRRVRDVCVAVDECQLLAFDQLVDHVSRIRLEPGKVDAVEHLQHLQQRHTLTVRRQLEDPQIAIIDRDRLDPLRALRGEVG